MKNEIEGKVIFLSSVNSPHIIPLLSNENINVILQENPHQKIRIIWNQDTDNQWTIIFPDHDNLDSRMTFTLPELLSKYLKLDNENIQRRAMDIKERNLRKFVFIAYFDKINPTICTLEFDREHNKKF